MRSLAIGLIGFIATPVGAGTPHPGQASRGIWPCPDAFAWEQSGGQEQLANAKRVFEKGQQALLSKNYPQAEKEFREVLELDPHSAAAYINLGVVYIRTNRFACPNRWQARGRLSFEPASRRRHWPIWKKR